MSKSPRIDVVFDEQTIARRVRELGAQITKDYGDEDVVLVGILKGAFVFLADLARAVPHASEIDFIGVASYAGTKSTGHVRLTRDLGVEIRGRHVIIVEDIVDTGKTLDYLLDMLRVREPKSLKICALLSKPEAHQMRYSIDYLGFEIPNDFVIGYGLDWDGKYRNLPYIGKVRS
jgi:hypoxanthine phosphoribosyltransferase